MKKGNFYDLPTSRSEDRKKEEGLSHPEEDRERNSQGVKKD